MGVTKVNVTTLPKVSLNLNLPGFAPAKPSDGFQQIVPVSFEFINLPIPSSTTDPDYNDWVDAR